MKKLLFPVITLVLTLSMILLMVIPAMAVAPTVTISRSDPDDVEINTSQDWTITIVICEVDGVNLDEVVVQGGIGADLVVKEVNSIPVPYPMDRKTDWPVGDVTLYKKGGKMGATIVKWNIGTLVSYSCDTLTLLVGTGFNPKDKQEFTSLGIHELDGGFSATYWFEDTEYETEETIPLTVNVEGVEEE